MYASLSLLSAVFALRGAYAAIYTDPSQLPSREYDYVIVGGTFCASQVPLEFRSNSDLFAGFRSSWSWWERRGSPTRGELYHKRTNHRSWRAVGFVFCA